MAHGDVPGKAGSGPLTPPPAQDGQRATSKRTPRGIFVPKRVSKKLPQSIAVELLEVHLDEEGMLRIELAARPHPDEEELCLRFVFVTKLGVKG